MVLQTSPYRVGKEFSNLKVRLKESGSSNEGEGVQQYFHIVSGGCLWSRSFFCLNWAWLGLLWKSLGWPTKAWRRWDNFGWNLGCLALVADDSWVVLHEGEVCGAPYVHEGNLQPLGREWHLLEVFSKAWSELVWENLLSFLSVFVTHKTGEDKETRDRNSWEEGLSQQLLFSESTEAAPRCEGVMRSWTVHQGSEEHERSGPGKVLISLVFIFYIK